MYKVILPLLLLQPPGGSWTQKLIQSEKNLNWKEAKEYCRAKGADLISILTDEEKQHYKNVEGWIDLHKDSPSSRWIWYRKNKFFNHSIWTFAPNDGEECAYHENGEDRLRSASCDDDKPFTCKKVTLLLVTENKTWEEALKHCRALEVKDPSRPINSYRNFRFDLATLPPKLHGLAQTIAKRATTDKIWTGLRYLADEWLWIGKGDVTYKDIEKCPRNGYCGTLPKAGEKSYEIRHCDEKRNFFCYRWENLDDLLNDAKVDIS